MNMNPFRSRRRAKDDSSAALISNQEPKSSGPFRRFGGTKRVQENEPRIQFDLSNALPSTDDLRTSLIMTGLSARFSMLREQDDPNTKLGKASDDSVLFPKRQSRMAEFGFGIGLTDIAEVESIKAPRFVGRIDSFHSSDDASYTSGSIMNRCKPIEGNNLFGGRQKIYKIPLSGSKLNAGLGGKVIYENDVALSAFQKLRLEQRSQGSVEDSPVKEELTTEILRTASSSTFDSSRRHQTSSINSSTPSQGRNSTADTSVVSQQPPGGTDTPVYNASSAAAGNNPSVERVISRPRRLYEPGLSQELQEQQSSALSRIDTLSRRNPGSRSPDGPSTASSQGTLNPFDRLGERRHLLSKASAPNLGLYSPPHSAASFVAAHETQPSSGGPAVLYSQGMMPSTPPVSDSDDIAFLFMHSAEAKKLASPSFTQKPAQNYDENRYAQRQLQMSKSREISSQRSRDGSIGSRTVSDTARSTSTVRRHSPLRELKATKSTREVEQVSSGPTTTNYNPVPTPSSAKPYILPNHNATVPDPPHPLFRSPASAMPGAPGAMLYNDPDRLINSVSRQLEHLLPSHQITDPINPSLNGLVRHHLQTASNTSSVYNQSPGSLTKDQSSHSLESMSLSPPNPRSASNPWDLQTGDWMSYYGVRNSTGVENVRPESKMDKMEQMDKVEQVAGSAEVQESTMTTDAFADILAIGARRVRERLTTYVEGDSRAGTPLPPPEPHRDLPINRSNPLGILKSKSSRGSLVDRSRENSQSRTMEKFGLGSVTPLTDSKPFALDERDPSAALAGGSEHPGEDYRGISDGDPIIPAGLRVFRQAKRELQRHGDLDTQQRHQYPVQPAPLPQYRERRPPPVTYSRAVDESRSSSRSSSRGPPDRERSSSDTSVRAGSRPLILRTGPPSLEEAQIITSRPRNSPITRSPGLSGVETLRSPVAPPNYHGRFERNPSSQSLNSQHHFRGYDSAQVSPNGPNLSNGPISPPRPTSGPSTPLLLSPQYVLSNSVNVDTNSNTPRIDDSLRRVVKKKDISEPTLISTTSQVPTIDLEPQAMSMRCRSLSSPRYGGQGGNASVNPQFAPPLPPINPRRRNMLGALRPRRGEEDLSLSTPHLPLPPPVLSTPDIAEDGRSAFSVSDDEDYTVRERRKLRKTLMEGKLSGLKIRSRGPSQSFGTTSRSDLNGMI